ncbi:SDR family oxidoreductase [Terrihabitans sp. B22-R8]|uniref:SDR family oxidoreductase n=1 Tax=Terrihabitans sp. B22-R8 TaxID=3425128 RepID=UPI00403D1371
MRLLVLGLGYSARAFVERHGKRFGEIVATVRDPDTARPLDNVRILTLKPGLPLSPDLVAAARGATHVLVSIPPDENGDTGLTALGETLAENPDLVWIGYLSTTGVYGDQAGRWIDEDTEATPGSARSRRRLAAEEGWRELATTDRAVQVFRLSNIYGPRRNPLAELKRGVAKRIDKPDQVFNRIHVEDIADAVAAAMDRPDAGPVFNLADDEPAAQHEVTAFAAGLLGVEPPAIVSYDEAEASMSEMAKSFWVENKRVRNSRLRSELGIKLSYPTYREGLTALHKSGEGG